MFTSSCPNAEAEKIPGIEASRACSLQQAQQEKWKKLIERRGEVLEIGDNVTIMLYVLRISDLILVERLEEGWRFEGK